MKTTIRATALAAFLAAAAVGAHAQSSVQIYGIIDAGVQWSDSDAPGEGSRLEVQTGNQAGTRLGFRGTEDLGGGLRAIFNLEAGIANDSGAILTFGEPGGTFFGRRSWVGLAGNFGEVLIGREYTPAWQTIFRTDRFRFGLPGTISTASGLVVSRANNGIFYNSPVMAGFRVRLAATAGSESATAPRDLGRLYGANLEYTRGNLYLAASAQTRRDARPGVAGESTSMKEYGAGMEYNFGRFIVSSGIWRADPVTATAGAIDETTAVWLGASMRVGTGQVQAQVTRTDVQAFGRPEGRAITAGLAYLHFLSKRTTVYAGVGTVSNDANARMPLNTGTARVGGTAFDADPRAVVIGMRHDF